MKKTRITRIYLKLKSYSEFHLIPFRDWTDKLAGHDIVLTWGFWSLVIQDDIYEGIGSYEKKSVVQRHLQKK